MSSPDGYRNRQKKRRLEDLDVASSSRAIFHSTVVTSLSCTAAGTLKSGKLPPGTFTSEINNPSEVNKNVNNETPYMPDIVNSVLSDDYHVPVNEDLLGAISSNSFSEAVALLTSKNTFTKSRLNQALLVACRRGHKLLVQTLVRAGANIGHRDKHKNTPLLICAENGFLDIVSFLVSSQANVNAVNCVGNTALILSVHRAGVTNMFRSLLEQRGVDIHHENNERHTIELCKVLIANGASVNCRNREGETPLMMAAAQDDRVDMLQLLLDNGADINDTDNKGNTALLHAVRGHTCKNVTCLINSATDKHILINVQNKKGITPLILSVEKGNVPIVRELIENGADVNIKDKKENTALHYQVSVHFYNRKEILTSLLKAGSDVNWQNSDGLSPLMLAAKRSMSSVISSLLDAGANVNAVSKKNKSQTALSFVRGYNFFASTETLLCIEILLNRGASCSYLSRDRLHKLIISDNIKVITKFFQHGVGPADLEAKKIFLRFRKPVVLSTVSPLCIALLVGKVSLARYFVDILFLTCSDLSMFASNKAMECVLKRKGLEDSLRFLQEISSQPMSLLKISLVTVSAAVGPFPGRETRVDSLPLPQMLKDKLLFKTMGDGHLYQDSMPKTTQSIVNACILFNNRRQMMQYIDSDEDVYFDSSDSTDSD